MVAAKVEEEILTWTERAGVLGAVKGEGALSLAEPGRPTPVIPSIASKSMRRSKLGLGDRFAHPVERSDRGEVEESASDRGHSEAAVNEAVDSLCVVDANAAKRSASPRTRDVGGTGHVGDQLPPVRGARVAQGCAGAGVENGGEQPALGAQRLAADGIDTGVDAVQPARGSPPRDCRGAEPALL